MAKKMYNEKLNGPSHLPKIEDLSDKSATVVRLGSSKMFITALTQYNEDMAHFTSNDWQLPFASGHKL